MELELDHLVVAASTLEEGVAHVAACLGLEDGLGAEPAAALWSPVGKHALWGTHNRCLGLEDGAYIEVIAVDPEAPPPARPRWFGPLDSPALQARLAAHGPLLLHWVARLAHGQDLHAAAATQPQLVPPVVDMERGPYKWAITVPTDGSLPGSSVAGGGLVPSLIQWRCARTPAQALPPTGLKVLRLSGRHRAAEGVAAALAAMGADKLKLFSLAQAASAAEPTLTATVWSTTHLRGARTLF